MIPDLSGLFYLAMLGLAALAVMIIAVPVAMAFGLAWLLEPRLGWIVWPVQFWSSIAWAVIVTLAFAFPFVRRV